MKKVTTHTLATLVLIGMISLTNVNVAALNVKSARTDERQLRRLEKIYQYHDRKHELRASVLGISADQLRIQLKNKPLESVVKKYGFRDRLSFYVAVTGKLKTELHRRGWSERKIDEYVQKRVARLTSTASKTLAFSV